MSHASTPAGFFFSLVPVKAEELFARASISGRSYEDRFRGTVNYKTAPVASIRVERDCGTPCPNAGGDGFAEVVSKERAVDVLYHSRCDHCPSIIAQEIGGVLRSAKWLILL